jgi:DNA-binding IclR family transcriptional regulator
MRRLLSQFGETVSLATPRGGNLIYVKMLESHHPFRMAAQVGSRLPIHSTAIGKAIAAFLPKAELDALVKRNGLRQLTPRTITSPAVLKRELQRTKARGYAEDNGETEPEASCIGAPIFGSDDHPLGAISISGPTSRILAIKSQAARALVGECKVLSHYFGHRPNGFDDK